MHNTNARHCHVHTLPRAEKRRMAHIIDMRKMMHARDGAGWCTYTVPCIRTRITCPRTRTCTRCSEPAPCCQKNCLRWPGRGGLKHKPRHHKLQTSPNVGNTCRRNHGNAFSCVLSSLIVCSAFPQGNAQRKARNKPSKSGCDVHPPPIVMTVRSCFLFFTKSNTILSLAST